MKTRKYFFPTFCGMAILLFPFCVKDPIYLNLMILVYFYAYLSMSWNIMGGFAGQLSLGHAVFALIGSYVTTLLFLRWHISPWFGMFAGGIAASAVSVIIGYPCFKLRGAYYALSTLAFAELGRILITNTDSFLGFKVNAARGLLLPALGHAPLQFQFVDKRYYYYIILIFCILLLVSLQAINHSRLGYYLAAIREDQEAAQALGINVPLAKLGAGIISAFYTALGGVFYTQYVLFTSAQSVGGMHMSLEMVFITIIGGAGTILGPILGSFFMTPLAELTRAWFGGTYFGIHLVFYGATLIVVIKFMPSGIIHPLEKFYRRIFKL